MLANSDTGSGKTLLFLHGLGLNKDFWSPTIAHLATTHRCIAVDLPGHGESRNVAANGSMSAYASSVRELIEKLNLNDVTLVGHSMGGQIAIILALQMPSVISRLVLVCSAGIETFTREEAEALKTGTNALYANPISDEILHKTFTHTRTEIKSMLMHEHIVQQRENFKQFSSLVTTSVAGMLNEPVIQFLDKITQSTLCIFGQLDTAIPNRWLHSQMTINQVAQTAKEKIANCELVIFPMAGHYLPVDEPMRLATEIRKIL